MLSLQRVWVHPLVPGQGTKILQAMLCGQIKKKKKNLQGNPAGWRPRRAVVESKVHLLAKFLLPPVSGGFNWLDEAHPD